MIKFDEVSALEFYTYLEDIKNRLVKDAPEWRLEQKTTSNPPKTLYHLGQWDFTKGRQKTWPVELSQFIFAYVQDDKHYLLNHHPIQNKQTK